MIKFCEIVWLLAEKNNLIQGKWLVSASKFACVHLYTEWPKSWPFRKKFVTRVAPFYTVSEKGSTELIAVTLSNVNRFSKFFHWRIPQEICSKAKIPSHLKCVATLPCHLLSTVFVEKLDSLWRRVGVMVAIFGALTMGLGIGEVVYPYMTVCKQSFTFSGFCLWPFTFYGIWGAAAVRITHRPII